MLAAQADVRRMSMVDQELSDSGARLGPVPDVEAAAQAIVHAGFRGEPSPYWNEPTWTEQNAEELIRRISAGGSGNFVEKLQKQLAGAAPGVCVLAAELISLHLLPISSTRGDTKRSQVNEVLGWSGIAYRIPEVIERGFTAGGTFNSSIGYNTSNWEHVVWLAKFVKHVRGLTEAQRAQALSNPEAFGELTAGVDHRPQGIKYALEYLIWPTYFEPVVSRDHRRRIRAAFAREIGDPSLGEDDAAIARDLAAIRRHQEELAGGHVDWYLPPFRDAWDPKRENRVPQGVDAAGHSDATPGEDIVGPSHGDGLLRDASKALAEELYIAREELQEVIEVLRAKNQIVFYGPPGTGKTYLATRLAHYLAGQDEDQNVVTVQFHPSYAYEDFFEGYRPALADNGHVGFRLEKGPLRRISEEAARPENRGRPFILVIDEMNRGNLAKVFGELYFLLEYRKEAIALQYSPGETFALPPNLFVIGTMNTADRSIAMVDSAIRRRFAFVELHPQDGIMADMLSRYLLANGKPPLNAHLLEALNREIDPSGRDLMIGPSYFMRDEADTDRGLQRIWRYELLPLLEEHYFGELDRTQVHARFGLDAIRRKAEEMTPARPADEGESLRAQDGSD